MNAPIAQTQRRREDARLVIGSGRYTGDLRPEGLLFLAFVRSPYAHARVIRIDPAVAAAAEGVVAVFTGADLLAAGLKHSPGGFRFARPDGQPAPRTDRPALVADRVRFLGEAVVAVIAETRAQAIAAAEQVEVEYEDAPAVSGADALQEGAPAVWDTALDNIAFRWQGGDSEATAAALQAATHVTRLTMRISRVSANPMETRIVLARPGEDGRLIIHASHQSPFNLRDGLAATGFEKDSLSVRVGDVGGSFGLKMGADPEAVVVAYAARTLQRPVLWESSRNEAFQADEHARELEATGEIGFDETNRIVGLKVRVNANLGAYVTGKSGWSVGNIGGIAGVYAIPAIHAEVYGVLTHTSPTAAYRGAGRPEATYIIERLLDVAAGELGVSPFALRRRNLIPSLAMPYRTALVFTYDCGEFEANMDTAEGLADVAGFEARRAEAARRGKLRGIGVCNCIEVAGGPFNAVMPDIARVSLLTSGRLRVRSGSMSVGQGHETTFPQMIADRFGVPADQVEYQQGDTDLLPFGRGNGGSSALCVGGTAVSQATTSLVGTLTDIAAELLEAPAETVTLSDGIFRSRDANRTLTLAEVAAAAKPVSDGVAAQGESTFKPPEVTFPNGTHICEVEIDPDTGVVNVVGYSAVEDIGRVIHPMLAEGQIQGGVTQGIGQALGEAIVYDETGQLLTGSFMDYQMPRAGDLPSYVLAFREVLTKVNPLGAKGVGEAGTVGALAAAMNAINDALAPLGIRHFEMPATPARVWEAIRAAGH
jgi:carbon-monoxide dehydrogenase large subunit